MEQDQELQVAVINVYCPRADPEKPERGLMKMQFYQLLRERAAVIRSTGVHIVIVGDINTSHQLIDHCDPDDPKIFRLNPGRRFLSNFFLPVSNEGYITKDKPVDKPHGNGEKHSTEGVPVHIEADDPKSSQETIDADEEAETLDVYPNEIRDLIEQIIESAVIDFQVVDTFRYFYPEKEEAFTCWNTKTNARSTNYGTRIDYVLCNPDILPQLEDSMVLPDIQGSDHCPVAATFKGTLIAAAKCPPVCTKYFPEFQGQQQKLSRYFMVQPRKADLDKSRMLIDSNQEAKSVSISLKRKSDETKEVKGKRVLRNEKPKQMKLSRFFSLEKDQNSTLSSVGNKDNNSKNKSLSSEDKITNKKVIDENRSKESSDENKKNNTKGNCVWASLLTGPKPPPLCPGHKEPAVQRTVKKKGQNFNRKFYACARGAGKDGDPEAQCNFFQWVGKG